MALLLDNIATWDGDRADEGGRVAEVKMLPQVQLLYSDPSLGARVEFLIKRLEILQVSTPMPM